MLEFIINKGYTDERTVKAAGFIEKDSLVSFLQPDARTQVFALPTKSVSTIELVES